MGQLSCALCRGMPHTPCRCLLHVGCPSHRLACSGHERPFRTLQEQRAHFRSDWHRLNVRRRLQHRPRLDEDAFEALMETNDAVRQLCALLCAGVDQDAAAPDSPSSCRR